jgi:hypothetical protein
MNQGFSSSLSHGTRLSRLLSELAVTDVQLAHSHFSERLGRLIDFGDSMRLSSVHADLRQLAFEPGPAAAAALRDEVGEVRLSLVRFVVEGFNLGAGAERVRLPAPSNGLSLEALSTFEPYHRFYAAHQREFEVKIQSLQRRVRDGVTGVSAELARLAKLDEAVRDMLSMQVRKYLAVIPVLLGKRFEFLYREHLSMQDDSAQQAVSVRTDDEVFKAWTQPNAWLDRFFGEMRGLLLAELELRLLPVMGLVEAAYIKTENQ